MNERFLIYERGLVIKSEIIFDYLVKILCYSTQKLSYITSL